MSRRQSRILWALALVLMLAQVVVATAFTKGNTTALVALTDANAAARGGFILSSPVMSLWGLICRVSGLSVWTFATKVLPIVLIPLCYGAYILLANRIDPDRAPVILILICLLQVYGYQSEAFAPYTLLLGWFTGKSILVHLVGPLAAYGLIRLREVLPERSAEQIEQTDDLEDTEMKNKYFNVRNISIAIVILAVGVAGALFILNRKINNLYAATVNLQKSIEEKGDFIEFRGADGEEVKGYVLVGNQGVTVIFGGSRKDGEALYELISKYGDQVDSWYLRRDEENGAYDYCSDQMLKVRHVYKIQGIDEVKN